MTLWQVSGCFADGRISRPVLLHYTGSGSVYPFRLTSPYRHDVSIKPACLAHWPHKAPTGSLFILNFLYDRLREATVSSLFLSELPYKSLWL